MVQNISAAAETAPEVIRPRLLAQIYSTVRWVESVQEMVANGATHFVEMGPGQVLSGLCKRIAPESTQFATGDLTRLDSAATALQEALQ